MNSFVKRISIAAAVLLLVLTAGLVFYATIPAMVLLIVPEAEPIWEPAVSGVQALAVLGGIVFVGILLALANHLRAVRANGNPVIPGIVWVVVLSIVGAAATAFVAVVVFGVTRQSLLDLGVPSSAALMVGLAVLVAVWLALSRK